MSDDTHDDDESTATNLFDATPVDDTEHTVDDVRRVAVFDDGTAIRGEPFEPLSVDGDSPCRDTRLGASHDDDDLAAVAWEHKLPDGGSD